MASQSIISAFLKSTGISIISEEENIPDFNERKSWSLCWIVDPLDGTKEFIKKNGQFTINIALIENGIPIMGVVYAPIPCQMYISEPGIAYKIEKFNQNDEFAHIKNSLYDIRKILPQNPGRNNFIVLASKSHQNPETTGYIEKLKTEHRNIEILSVGSSLKFCMIAEGKADLYPRFSTIMEWDTAAGHAILDAAGGRVFNPETGLSLTYNKENLLNPWFIASK